MKFRLGSEIRCCSEFSSVFFEYYISLIIRRGQDLEIQAEGPFQEI